MLGNMVSWLRHWAVTQRIWIQFLALTASPWANHFTAFILAIPNVEEPWQHFFCPLPPSPRHGPPVHPTSCTQLREWGLCSLWSSLSSAEMKYIYIRNCLASLKALLSGPQNKQIVKKKPKALLQKASPMPSFLSIAASVAMKASLVLLAVAGAELLLLFLLINIFAAKAAPAVPAFRGCLQTPTECGSPALRVLHFGLGSRAAAFPSGGCACLSSRPWVWSFSSCQQWEAKESLLNLWSPKYP